MADDNSQRKLLGAVRELVEKHAPEVGISVEELTKMVLDTEREIPGEHRGVLERQFGALFGVLTRLQPAVVDQVFVIAGRKKKGDTRPLLPKWVPEIFGIATVETTFLELPDGRILEEIYAKGAPAFVVYTPVPERWEILPSLEVDGLSYVPRAIPPELLEVVTFADGIEPYDNPAVLIDTMERLGLDVFDPGEDEDVFRLMIRLAFVSWVVSGLFPPRYLGGATDRFLPGLHAVGLPQSGKGRRLAISQHLFYRTIYLLSTSRVPSIFRTVSPWGWGSTLILDEADLPYSGSHSETVEFLNARAYGKPPVRYNADKDASIPFLTFGYTIIASREAYDDPGWNSRAIPLASASSLRPLEPPLVINMEWEARAAKLRRQLLLFRMRTLVAIREGLVKVPDRLPLARHFEPRLRAAFLPLFALAGSDPRLTQDAIGLAMEIGKRQTANRAESWEGTVIGCIYEKLRDGRWVTDLIESGASRKSFRLLIKRPPEKPPAASTPKVNPVEETPPQRREEEKAEPTEGPVLMRTLCAALPGEPKSKSVSRVLKSIPLRVQAQDRVGGPRYRSILIVDNPGRLVDAFSKYVVDPDLNDIRSLFGMDPQKTLDEPSPESAGEGGDEA